jgi:hypothetical protein
MQGINHDGPHHRLWNAGDMLLIASPCHDGMSLTLGSLNNNKQMYLSIWKASKALLLIKAMIQKPWYSRLITSCPKLVSVPRSASGSCEKHASLFASQAGRKCKCSRTVTKQWSSGQAMCNQIECNKACMQQDLSSTGRCLRHSTVQDMTVR